MSQTVRTIFGRYTDRVQPFGIDEAWLDLDRARYDAGAGRSASPIICAIPCGRKPA